MKKLNAGITAPKGYRAAGVFCGIKKKKLDLAMLTSDIPAQAAGAFTRNVVCAAPVHWDRRIIALGSPVSAVVINSGNANACTGKQGMEDTEAMAKLTGTLLGTPMDAVLICSTGVIGVPLPMEQVSSGITAASAELGRGSAKDDDAAQSILTTDTFIKQECVEIDIEGTPVRIAGIAKGSGMIHPNMATMLSFILTDAAVEEGLLQELLGSSIQDSYNMISIDGDTSTNDTVLALANGAAGNPVITRNSKHLETFTEAFDAVNASLARQIVLDGEGATKFIEARVSGAPSKEDARKLVKSVITSNLVKTAFFGEDANWGRILCAMGYSGAFFTPETTRLEISSAGGSLLLLDEGTPAGFDEAQALKVLKEREITITITLSDGSDSAAAWGCDLSYEYVKINGEYRT